MSPNPNLETVLTSDRSWKCQRHRSFSRRFHKPTPKWHGVFRYFYWSLRRPHPVDRSSRVASFGISAERRLCPFPWAPTGVRVFCRRCGRSSYRFFTTSWCPQQCYGQRGRRPGLSPGGRFIDGDEGNGRWAERKCRVLQRVGQHDPVRRRY